MDNDFDLIIIGGGLAGCSLALALANTTLKIAILEARPIVFDEQDQHDARSVGLSYGSYKIFSKYGLSDEIKKIATPIKQINVTDKGLFGFTRIKAEQLAIEALGYNVEIQQLQATLFEKLSHYDTIRVVAPAKVVAMQKNNHHWELIIEKNQQTEMYKGKLVVAADGGNSSVRQLLKINARVKDYKQSAIVANISLARSHNNIAHERFTKHGPIAMLPMNEQRVALIWTLPTESAALMASETDENFLYKLQKAFGYRLGKFIKVGKRVIYPLQMVACEKQISDRLILLGNAAHTLHPIAAQGFNLGLRDVACLAELIHRAKSQEKDIASDEILMEYLQRRKKDQKKIMRFTDGLVRIFSNDFFPLELIRNISMLGLDIIPGFKKLFAEYGIGGSDKKLWLPVKDGE